MAVQKTISNLARGDDWIIRRTIYPGVPMDGIDTAWFYLKADRGTADSDAIITKEITTATDPDTVGYIVDTGADPGGNGSAIVEFRFVEAETSVLDLPRNGYYYVIRVHTPTSNITNTPEVGGLVLQA